MARAAAGTALLPLLVENGVGGALLRVCGAWRLREGLPLVCCNQGPHMAEEVLVQPFTPAFSLTFKPAFSLSVGKLHSDPLWSHKPTDKHHADQKSVWRYILSCSSDLHRGPWVQYIPPLCAMMTTYSSECHSM